MIYLLPLLYLVILIVVYDIGGRKHNKYLHFALVLAGMILISGLRYRLGRDTPIYMDYFSDYPTFSRLTWKDFTDLEYQPLWIILNVCARSLGEFAIVQLVASAVHIGVWGYALKKICPSLIFSALFFYYLFDYLNFNMLAMRESMAVGFFLLALLALNKGQKIRMTLWISAAVLCHIFALPISIAFLLYYKFLATRPAAGLLLVVCIALLVLTFQDILSAILVIVFSNSDSTIAHEVMNYSTSEFYSGNHQSLPAKIHLFCKVFFYLYALRFLVKTSLYDRFIHINQRIFASMIWLGVLFLLCNFSMHIFYRPYNYCIFFINILTVLFLKSLTLKIAPRQRTPVYLCMLTVPFLFAMRSMLLPDPLNPNEPLYANYYPYSSIFDKTIDPHRENIYKDRYD